MTRILSVMASVLLSSSILMAGTICAHASTPEITSDYAIVIDADSGSVLYEKNAYERAYPASTTKIMTGLLVAENCLNLDEVVTVGDEVNRFSAANSLMENKQGEEITIRDLFYGMMLISGNDAAATLGIHLGGSFEGFADMMNAKAKELGMNDTHFINPHGIHDENHYTTAADMAILMQYAIKNETFAKVVGTPEYTCQPTNKRKSEKVLYNTNKFITSKESEQDFHWSAVNGGKTGHTSAAQGCLVTSIHKDGKNIISVLFHDTSEKSIARWTESRELLEYGLDNLSLVSLNELTLPELSTTVFEASRKDPESGELGLSIDTAGITISGLKSDMDKIKANPSLLEIVPIINNDEQLVAPITKGQIVGTAAIKFDDRTLTVANLVSTRDVASVSSDPTNPINTLIQSVVSPSDSFFTPGVIALLALGVLILILIILLIWRKRRLVHLNRAAHRRRKSGYYNYYKR